MKKIILILMITSFNLNAQQGFVMFNQNKVEFANQNKAYKIFDDYFNPVWNQLVDEGMITSYSLMTHGWGDEWNLNYMIVTESHEAFLKAWSEGFKRIRNSMPQEKWNELMKYTLEHKDNLYSLRHHYSGK
tara:strand:+ start:6372 stop:6764 length:393 start_codon:yes stop_codon:yes gene_type:complete